MNIQSLIPWAPLLLLIDLLLILGLSLRVIMRRLPVGVTFAWLFLVVVFPLGGIFLYLLFGELRLGYRRGQRAARLHAPFAAWLEQLGRRYQVTFDASQDQAEALSRVAFNSTRIPPLPDTQLELLIETDAIFERLVADIDAAERSCHLEFYIWQSGGWADAVAEALWRAAERGVVCRMLLDDVGSRAFLRGPEVRRLRQAGIEVQGALPAGLLRSLFRRFDLRLHRKIVVIDGKIGYTGSLNLVDPAYFPKARRVGKWIDAMARISGPAVEPLEITFIEDWLLETGATLPQLIEDPAVWWDQSAQQSQGGECCGGVQVIPSGPLQNPLAMERVLLNSIFLARQELVLTTPYFVPSDGLLEALVAAVLRGVEVTLIVPHHNDSWLVALASYPYLGELSMAGVKVRLFTGGLLHTKSVTIDGQVSLFGTVNLDPRSLYLNFEVALAVYQPEFTRCLHQVQMNYVAQTVPFPVEAWQARSAPRRLVNNMARLLKPLL
jgi:cardiolipin synthase A/B